MIEECVALSVHWEVPNPPKLIVTLPFTNAPLEKHYNDDCLLSLQDPLKEKDVTLITINIAFIPAYLMASEWEEPPFGCCEDSQILDGLLNFHYLMCINLGTIALLLSVEQS